MKKRLPVLIPIVLIIIIGTILAGSIVIKKYSYSKERADLNEYFGITEESDVAIILQDEIIAEQALLKDGVYYLDMNTVHTYFNERFYLDESVEGSSLLLYTTTSETYKNTVGSDEYTVDGNGTQMGYPISIYENDVCYIAIDYVKMFTNMSYQAFTNPNRIQIDNEWSEVATATIKKDTQVRHRGGVKSEILEDVSKGDTVTVLEKLDSWTKVKTADSVIGYVPSRHLTDEVTVAEAAVADVEEPYYQGEGMEGKVNMAWHQVMSVSASDTIYDLLPNTKAVNVIAPTWFMLSGTTGDYICNASSSYVDYAHGQGLKVWAVIDNFNAETTLYEVLKNTSQRETLTANLMRDCKTYGIDGINVDFEQVSTETTDHYIQFIREMSVACHRNGLVLSVDNYVPTNYTDHYNRAEQGRYADYVVIMGYDEHYGGSPEAGSVASIGYVEAGIADTTQIVDPSKVINGIPFYARGWATTGDNVTSQTLTMEGQRNFVSQYGMETIWDDATGQYYAEATVGDTLYQIWMEDTTSIGLKLNVMNSYGIAGVAEWKLGLEDPQVWDTISTYVNQ